MAFNNFPYTDFHELNLDWVLKKLEEIEGRRFMPIFAAPLEWNGETAYEAYTIVTYNGNGYMSKVANIGKSPTNEEYWVQVSNYNAQFDELKTDIEQAKAMAHDFNIAGKHIVFFGDSLFWGDSGDSSHSAVTISIPDFIKNMTGCKVSNYALRSRRMSSYGGDNRDFRSEIAGAVAQDVDIVMIHFMTNDVSANVPIGAITDTDWGTFCGAFNSGVDAVHNKYPSAEIICCGAFPSSRWYNHGTNSHVATMNAYQEHLYRMCVNKGVKFINMLDCGIDSINLGIYSPDGVHFNQSGYNLLGLHILRNLGGNNYNLMTGNNEFNPAMYPSYDRFKNYSIIHNGNAGTLTSFTPFTLNPGFYKVSVKYHAEMITYNNEVKFCGIIVNVGGVRTAGLRDIVNGDGLLSTITYVPETRTGNLSLRLDSNLTTSDAVSELFVAELQIIPISTTLENNYRYDVTIDNDNASGTITIVRGADSAITLTGNLSAKQALTSYKVLAQNIGFRHFTNETGTKYFVASTGGSSFLRGQLNSSGISVGGALTSGQSVTFSFTW